tara:strand:- start:55 stop:1761 length:1707 start_codon:yes stop_codon:yes gene_type:complete
MEQKLDDVILSMPNSFQKIWQIISKHDSVIYGGFLRTLFANNTTIHEQIEILTKYLFEDGGDLDLCIKRKIPYFISNLRVTVGHKNIKIKKTENGYWENSTKHLFLQLPEGQLKLDISHDLSTADSACDALCYDFKTQLIGRLPLSPLEYNEVCFDEMDQVIYDIENKLITLNHFELAGDNELNNNQLVPPLIKNTRLIKRIIHLVRNRDFRINEQDDYTRQYVLHIAFESDISQYSFEDMFKVFNSVFFPTDSSLFIEDDVEFLCAFAFHHPEILDYCHNYLKRFTSAFCDNCITYCGPPYPLVSWIIDNLTPIDINTLPVNNLQTLAIILSAERDWDRVNLIIHRVNRHICGCFGSKIDWINSTIKDPTESLHFLLTSDRQDKTDIEHQCTLECALKIYNQKLPNKYTFAKKAIEYKRLEIFKYINSSNKYTHWKHCHIYNWATAKDIEYLQQHFERPVQMFDFLFISDIEQVIKSYHKNPWFSESYRAKLIRSIIRDCPHKLRHLKSVVTENELITAVENVVDENGDFDSYLSHILLCDLALSMDKILPKTTPSDIIDTIRSFLY